MSQLKIYTNAQNEIRALYYTDDKTLTEHIINREEIFGNHTDAFILGYTYEEVKDSGGAVQSIISTPYVDRHQLDIVEQSQKEGNYDNFIIVNHSTLAEVLEFHKKAIGKIGSALIEAGFDLGDSHYSLTPYDQINITTLYAQVALGGVSNVAWHADNESCKIISAEEMTQIGQMAMAYVTYHTTRINMLGLMVKECTTKKQCLAITYKTPLDSTRSAQFESIMTSMGVTGEVRTYCDASVALAGDVVGEIYSTAGSLIEPELYDTEPALNLEAASVTTEPVTCVTPFKIPTKFVDRDKLDAEGTTSTNLSAIFNKLTNVDGALHEELTSDFVLQYKLETDSDSSYLQVDMANNNVVSMLLPVETLYNEITDKVNEAQTVYLIKTASVQQITTDITQVYKILSIIQDDEGAGDDVVE